MDAYVVAVQSILETIHQKTREQLEGVPAEGLNWRPGHETSSLYVLATHMLGAERFYLHKALGQEVERDRPAEFAASGEDAQAFHQRLNAADQEMRRLLGSMTPKHLAQETELRGAVHSGAWYLANLVSHLSEHVGHLNLTRQLWEQQR